MAIGTSSWFLLIWTGIKSGTKVISAYIGNWWRRETKRKERRDAATQLFVKGQSEGDINKTVGSVGKAAEIK